MNIFTACILVVFAAAWPKTYTTDFDGSENPLSEGGEWNHTGLDWTKVEKVNGLAYGTQTGSGGYDDSYATLSGFAPDQTAWAEVVRASGASGNHEVEILLRWSDSAHNARGYEILLPYNTAYPPHIVRWNGPFGDFTFLKRGDISVTPKTGDIWKGSIKGNLIIGYLNGTEIIRATDNTYSDGNPGIGFYKEQGGSCSDMAFTNFTATDSVTVGTEGLPGRAPGRFFLAQNAPNPFRRGTLLNYEIPRQGQVTLAVYDMSGRRASVLVNGNMPAGSHTAGFDGSALAPGVYTARLSSGGLVQVRRIVLIR